VTTEPLCSVPGCPAPTSDDWHRCFVCGKRPIDHQHFPKKSLAGKGAKIVAALCRKHHDKITLHQWREGVFTHPDGSVRYYVQNEKGEQQCERIIEAAPAHGEPVEPRLPAVKEPSAREQVAKASAKGRQALELASSVGEVKNIRDRANALRMYAQACGLGLQAQNEMADIKIRAERKAGQLLRVIEREPGKRKGLTSLQAAIRSVGIDSAMAHRWQLEAELPDLEYEAYAQTCNQEGIELTTAGILRLIRALLREGEEPESPCPKSATGRHEYVCRHCGKER